jgi:hypothetical protein
MVKGKPLYPSSQNATFIWGLTKEEHWLFFDPSILYSHVLSWGVHRDSLFVIFECPIVISSYIPVYSPNLLPLSVNIVAL